MVESIKSLENSVNLHKEIYNQCVRETEGYLMLLLRLYDIAMNYNGPAYNFKLYSVSEKPFSNLRDIQNMYYLSRNKIFYQDSVIKTLENRIQKLRSMTDKERIYEAVLNAIKDTIEGIKIDRGLIK